jgi:hypothetical protein
MSPIWSFFYTKGFYYLNKSDMVASELARQVLREQPPNQTRDNREGERA